MNLEDLQLKKKNIWQEVSKEEHDAIFAYGEDYKNFLDYGKTERLATKFLLAEAKKNGFVALDQAVKNGLKAGDKIYLNNKDKSLVLMVLGKDDLENGMNIVGAHIDSPRLDLKANPLYEDSNLALLKTHYYGGIKKYQWTTIPLALHGVIVNSEDEMIEISIGDKEDDPVFYITDLLAHLSADLNKKTMAEGITGESLNLLAGHSSFAIDDKENPIKKAILKKLYDDYKIVEEDFQIAELEAVPAGKARDVGFDRSMIAAHGHDDRVCSYAAFKAIMEIENPEKTAVVLLVDKEEIGSVGNTGMQAKFFENMVAEVSAGLGHHSNLLVRRALANSKCLSADVSPAMDPDYKDTMDPLNSAYLGQGICMSKYVGARGKGGSNDANAEFLREVRNIFRANNVIYQTGELGKIDQGGGGTIAGYVAKYGAEVLDIGTAMLSMHAPIELVSKADAYMTYKAYKAFIK